MKNRLSVSAQISFIIIASAVSLWPGRSVHASTDPGTLFSDSLAQYEAADYDGSARTIELMTASGDAGANLYYNLGNSYFKQGKIGRAILSYERAGFLAPRDSDINSNLKLARSKIKQKEPEAKSNRIWRSVNIAFGYLRVSEQVVIAIFFYYLSAAMLALVIWFKNLRRYFSPLIILSVAALMVTALPLLSRIEYTKTLAVVTDTITDAKFEPALRAMRAFPLYEGMRVNIIGLSGDWYKVKRLDGKIGWVEAKSVERVVRQNQPTGLVGGSVK